jgi:hypothetical protein
LLQPLLACPGRRVLLLLLLLLLLIAAGPVGLPVHVVAAAAVDGP